MSISSISHCREKWEQEEAGWWTCRLGGVCEEKYTVTGRHTGWYWYARDGSEDGPFDGLWLAAEDLERHCKGLTVGT